ncbi:MAG: hypothetical protein WC354_07395 [Candidatus Omnitrophota bacterium]|jgi:hypothetical protein
MKTTWVLLFLFIPTCCFSKESCLNLVFCPVNYQSEKIFIEDTIAIASRLKKTAPFKDISNRISFFRLVLSPEEQKQFLQRSQGIPPLKINRALLNRTGHSIKSAYKLVLIDAKGGVSCAELSEISKVSLIILGRSRYGSADSFTKGFLHELGHSLGLRDEGLNSQAALCQPGPPNCAVTEEEAKNWWGDLAGKVSRVNYINGCCGNISYFRPTIASLMNDPDKANDFGPVNERYLTQTLQTLYRTACDTEGYK